MEASVLKASKIFKRFGPVQALSDVDFHLETGEIHALLGVNGAGKSTFIKILSGVIQADSGELQINGEIVHFRNPDDAIRAGIATVQQHPELVADMSGLDNIFLGRETAKRGLMGLVKTSKLKERAEALLSRFAVPIDLSQEVTRMSAVEREAVAILQAIAVDEIKVLILDEPTSTLTEVEREDLFALMRQLRAHGIAIIYITHHLEEVFAIADNLSVFRGGTCVARMSVEEARHSGVSLADLMLGEEVGDVFPPKADPDSQREVFLEVQKLSSSGDFKDVSFTSCRGEILGFFGLVGSGIEELAKAIFAFKPPESGDVFVLGQKRVLRTPRDALDAGIFLVPGDRRTEGLALTQHALFNVPMANLRRASNGRWRLRHVRLYDDVKRLTDQVALHPPHLTTPVSGFSGGNQQKIVLAKGLYSKANIYIFVEPTIGVDIGARAKIYGIMRELSRDAAIIVMSSDCDEVYGVSDRVLALYKGQLVEPAHGAFSRDELLIAGIMGGEKHES